MAKPQKKPMYSKKPQATSQMTTQTEACPPSIPSSVEKKKIQSRDQLRAKHALTEIERLKQQNADSAKVKSAVSGLPAMIHMNGLGHAFAFFLSDVKNFRERAQVVNIVFDWLSSADCKIFDKADLTPLTAITQTDLQTYQIAQQETQAYLLWLKKFARALLTDDDRQEA